MENKDNQEDKERRGLFEYSDPIEEGYLKVSDIHTIYYEVSGNPKGKPVIVFHGGPGSGSNKAFRGFFDQKEFKIVQMDQRGCGKSKPFMCLEENTTDNLADDAEKLRLHLNIEKWHIVLGGSWGSALSLYYSQKYPDSCCSLILIGIFLVRQSELDFMYKEGTSWIYPDYFEELKLGLPKEEQDEILKNYYKHFSSKEEDESYKKRLSKIWASYEKRISKLIPDYDNYLQFVKNDDMHLAFSLVETHYFVNKGFMKSENQLLDNCEKISHLPCIIIQGRYDVVCPIKSAWDLHKKLPKSKLIIIPDSGHSGSEPGIIDAIVRSTDEFKSFYN